MSKHQSKKASGTGFDPVEVAEQSNQVSKKIHNALTKLDGNISSAAVLAGLMNQSALVAFFLGQTRDRYLELCGTMFDMTGKDVLSVINEDEGIN